MALNSEKLSKKKELAIRAYNDRHLREVSATDILIALARKHQIQDDFFLTQVKNGRTWGAKDLRILDAVAIKKSWSKPCITGYEVKVSKSDFKSDEKWGFYLKYCHRFYFVCPSRLIYPSEIPLPEVGLIWYNPTKESLHVKRKATFRPIELPTEMLYYILISRVESERDPFFSHKKNYFKKWLETKGEGLMIGGDIRYYVSKKLSELYDYAKKAKEIAERYERSHKTLIKIVEVINKYRILGTPIPSYRIGSIPKLLEEKFSSVEVEATKVYPDLRRIYLDLKQIFERESDGKK